MHLYGQMVDMKAVKEIVGSRNIKLIEDACQAHGALYDGKPPGVYSDCACYSFYPGKNLGTYGDGGAVTTDDSRLTGMVAKLRDHGRGPSDKYTHPLEGYNERLDTLQAAVLRVKLKRLDEWVRMRGDVAAEYGKALTGVTGVITPFVDKKARHAYHLYVISIARRDESFFHP